MSETMKKYLIQGGILLAIALGGGGYVYTQLPKDEPAPVTPVAPVTPESPAKPDEPKKKAELKIKVAESYRVGQLIVLDASDSVADSITWKTDNPNFIQVENGKKAFFTAEKSGIYTIVVVAESGGTVDIQVLNIKVNDPPPPLSEMAVKIKVWMTDVNYVGKKQDAIKLANSFYKVADSLTEKMTAKEIIEVTQRSNREVMGSDLAYWKPMLVGMQTELNARGAAGSLSTASQHAALWREIADALMRLSEEW